tara:strand:- start:335 stop:508 length:174 start_codon:yes stop_codon:yes gene_type:complete
MAKDKNDDVEHLNVTQQTFSSILARTAPLDSGDFGDSNINAISWMPLDVCSYSSSAL